MAGVDPVRWQYGFDEVAGWIGSRFTRVEPRKRARLFLLGLLAGLPRGNCWTIAEHAGEASPDGMQHLLSRAVWVAEAVRDDLRGYVVDHLGESGAVLVVDQTGDLKKGIHTVGVPRQYTGTAGRIENAQVGVYRMYAAECGHAFIDRALYLPKSWTTDPDRCRAAGVPDNTRFATKPALAREMITHALDAGVPAAWVAGDVARRLLRHAGEHAYALRTEAQSAGGFVAPGKTPENAQAEVSPMHRQAAPAEVANVRARLISGGMTSRQ